MTPKTLLLGHTKKGQRLRTEYSNGHRTIDWQQAITLVEQNKPGLQGEAQR
jgi:hypothetical protein